MARQRINEGDISHQVDLRMLRDIIKIVRQLKTAPAEGEDKTKNIDE